MKKIYFVLLLASLVCGSYGCKKEAATQMSSEKLEFIDLRIGNPSPFVFVDDTVAQTTVVKLNGEVILLETWEQGIYAGPIIKARLYWAQSESKINFLIVGTRDLFINQLLVVTKDGVASSHFISIIALKKAELRGENTLLLTHNNSWTRTGPMPDMETVVKFNP